MGPGKKSVNEIAASAAPFFPDTDIEIVRAVVKRYKDQGSFATDPIIDDKEWDNLQTVMEAAGELKKRVDLKTLVDNSFAEKKQ